MNESEIAAALSSSLERRSARDRRRLLGALVVVLAVSGGIGYAVGASHDRSNTAAIVALDDGAPAAQPSDPVIEPKNVDEAVAEITRAFHDAFDGGVSDEARRAATQGGALVDDLRREALTIAQSRGITTEELAGISIEVLGTTFVDRTHGVVHFTMTVPGRGAVLADQIGYAVFDGGRWRVSLRTTCDLLSLGGLGAQCPPPAPAGVGGR